MRGKGQKGLIFVLQPRITPAYAGKRLLRQLRHITSRDHPRVCGEKVGPVGCVSGWLGSPPRMRGKVWHGVALADGHRITPAYAGKSCIYRSTTSISWDHPRVCGEKSFKTSTSCWSKGSPPRMRGKGIQPCNQWVRVGITPAYAGKSAHRVRRSDSMRDHPRVCGEKHTTFFVRPRKWGSPPRMRGKGIQPCNQWVRVGITPAYAGKSAHRVRRSDSMRDHPRVCGEKHTTFFVRPRKWGSPPRMRGKVTGSARAPLNARITPAYAGKSLTIQKMTTRSRDHPRVCGEKRLTAKPLPGC